MRRLLFPIALGALLAFGAYPWVMLAAGHGPTFNAPAPIHARHHNSRHP